MQHQINIYNYVCDNKICKIYFIFAKFEKKISLKNNNSIQLYLLYTLVKISIIINTRNIKIVLKLIKIILKTIKL